MEHKVFGKEATMKKAIGLVALFLILFLSAGAITKAAEKALIFPVEFTTNQESKAWDKNHTHIFLSSESGKKNLSTKMKISFDIYVPRSLMKKKGIVLTLSPSLALFDNAWIWESNVHPQLEDINITKRGAGYRYSFYDPSKKKDVYRKKYVSFKKCGKYTKISVKKLPLLNYGKTDSGKKKIKNNMKRKTEFNLSVVGCRKGKAMLYIDNVKVHSGNKLIISDSLNKEKYSYAEINRTKECFLRIANFQKNKIPAYKKVPDDIRNVTAKNYVSRTSKKATTSTIKTDTKTKAKKMATATYQSLPSWHGFNLTTMYEYGWSGETHQDYFYTKKQVDEIAKQGVNFLRVTMDSRIVYSQKMTNGSGMFFKGNDKKVNLVVLKNIDNLITWCVNKGIHVCLDLHNTPGGYMIGGDEEASRELLFTDGSKEQQYFYNFWKLMAKRYKGISSNAVSFNLYNEPPDFATDEQYSKMMKKAIDDIHNIDPDRLLFVDMLSYGKKPIQGLVGEKIVQSSHIYNPNDFTHTNFDKAEDVKRGFKYSTVTYDYDNFHAEVLARLEEIDQFRKETGTTVMVQEFGCTNYNKIEDIVMYCEDMLSLFKEYSLPWAMWDYDSGTFGYVNTIEATRIPGAHYVKIGDHRYVAKEVRDVLKKYMGS